MGVGCFLPRGLVWEVPPFIEGEGGGDWAVNAYADFVSLLVRVGCFVRVRLVEAVVAVNSGGKSGDSVGCAGSEFASRWRRELRGVKGDFLVKSWRNASTRDVLCAVRANDREPVLRGWWRRSGDGWAS